MDLLQSVHALLELNVLIRQLRLLVDLAQLLLDILLCALREGLEA